MDDITVSPLPEEIGNLVLELQAWIDENCSGPDWLAGKTIHQKSAAALERTVRENMDLQRHNGVLKAHVQSNMDRGDELAQKNERLKERLEEQCQRGVSFAEQRDNKMSENNWLAARIRELEAERDTLSKLLNATEDQRDRVWEERDAIKAKTIEECATVKVTIPQKAFAMGEAAYLDGFQDGALAQIEAIRALNQSQEKPSAEIRVK